MAKDFLEELNEELNALLLSEVERLREAAEKKERLPLIMTPALVMRTVHRVAMNHNITGEELLQMMGTQELSAKDAAAVREAAARLSQDSEAK